MGIGERIRWGKFFLREFCRANLGHPAAQFEEGCRTGTTPNPRAAPQVRLVAPPPVFLLLAPAPEPLAPRSLPLRSCAGRKWNLGVEPTGVPLSLQRLNPLS